MFELKGFKIVKKTHICSKQNQYCPLFSFDLGSNLIKNA